MKKSLLMLAVCCFASVACALPKVEVSLRVVDESGTPLEGADALVVFHRDKQDGSGWGINTFPIHGTTDTNGLYVVSEPSEASINVIAKKEGYYKASLTVAPEEFKMRKDKAWSVSCQLKLRRIKKPVPMIYMHGADWIDVPTNHPAAFDLEIGDWVAPSGRGRVSDLIFQVRKLAGVRGSKCIVGFSGKEDGIQEYCFDPEERSEFKWPYEAPLDGYTNQLSKSKILLGGGVVDTNVKKYDEINYIFRVRTEVDKDGNVVKANYGKILGEIDLSADGWLKFRYWLNPDNESRSLEHSKDTRLIGIESK